jgi:hypothetical protein
MHPNRPVAFLIAVALAAPAARAQAPIAKQGVVRGNYATARGQATLRIQTEDHEDFGRLLFPQRRRGEYTTSVSGSVMVVNYPRGLKPEAPDKMPRNVVTIVTGPSRTVITGVPGSELRGVRLDGNLTVDIHDPAGIAPAPRPSPAAPQASNPAAPASAASAAAAANAALGLTASAAANRAPATAPAPGATPAAAPVAAPAGTPAVATAAATPATPSTPPAPPVDPADKADAIAAVLAPTSTSIDPVTESVQPAIFIKAAPTVGAAAFRLGNDLVLVLDAPIKLDATGLQGDQVFGHTSVQQLQDAVVVHIPLAAPASLHLARSPTGWTITAIPAAEAILGIAPRLVKDTLSPRPRLQLPVAQPSRSIVVLDHITGQRLLVGTQTSTGQGIANGREMVPFSLIPTIQGLAVTSASDDITLRRDLGSFSVVLGPHAGSTSLSDDDILPAAGPDSTMLSRMYDFVDLPIPKLRDRLTARIDAAVAAPALSRTLPRQRVAETMVELGLGVEAQAVLDIAVASDPAAINRPAIIGLRAIAAVVNGRLAEAGGLADPRLTGTSEITLWRALLVAEQDEDSTRAARDLAATIPLLLAYPEGLQDRFLPEALQTMALGGQVKAAAAVLEKRSDDPALDLARGIVAEMKGDSDAALKLYAAVANRPDRLPRYKALVRAVGVHLARGDYGPREAADALDQALYAWRGDKDELALRIHMADLRRQTGQWHNAITLLREARDAFPESRAKIDSELAGLFTALFEGDAVKKMAPADFVALYDQNTDLLREAPWSERAGTALVNRLVALDLPGRADPVLMQMIAQSADPMKKALLGARLASVRLTANNPAGALTALGDSSPTPSAQPMDPDITQTRQLLYARAEAERGNTDAAITMLTALTTPAADDLRADLYSGQKNWKGAVSALMELEQKSLPPAGNALTPAQQAIVMREASAATLAGDQDTIDRLRETRGDAMANGPSAEAFKLITSAPVDKTADLPRAYDEIRMAKQWPQQLAQGAP